MKGKNMTNREICNGFCIGDKIEFVTPSESEKINVGDTGIITNIMRSNHLDNLEFYINMDNKINQMHSVDKLWREMEFVHEDGFGTWLCSENIDSIRKIG